MLLNSKSWVLTTDINWMVKNASSHLCRYFFWWTDQKGQVWVNFQFCGIKRTIFSSGHWKKSIWGQFVSHMCHQRWLVRWLIWVTMLSLSLSQMEKIQFELTTPQPTQHNWIQNVTPMSPLLAVRIFVFHLFRQPEAGPIQYQPPWCSVLWWQSNVLQGKMN